MVMSVSVVIIAKSPPSVFNPCYPDVGYAAGVRW